jgi:transmembrane sensor
VLTNESNRFVALLDHGRAHFDVRPGGPRSWQIETSRATVEVVGTAFVVDADDHRLVVEVERGIVIVRGERVPGRVVRLTAGQHIGIEDPVVKTAAIPATPAVPVAPVAVAPAPVPPPPPVAVAERQPPAVHAPPVQHVPPVAVAPSGSELAAAMTEADTRRANGDAAGAAAVLETALATARDAESKGMAEFTLGRLYLEQLGQPDRAAETFARMIALGQPLGLLEDAHARRIMALVKAGRRDEASAALADYDRAYPHGAHHAMVHALVSPRSP